MENQKNYKLKQVKKVNISLVCSILFCFFLDIFITIIGLNRQLQEQNIFNSVSVVFVLIIMLDVSIFTKYVNDIIANYIIFNMLLVITCIYPFILSMNIQLLIGC